MSGASYTRQKAFFENIRNAREQGFACPEQEFEEGINAIAALITNSSGMPIASVSIAGPAYRLSFECMMEIGPNLGAVAKSISQKAERAANLA